MKYRTRFTAAVLGLCLAASFGAYADNADSKELTEIREQQTEMLADVRAGEGAFGDMSDAEREELAARQVKLLALIEGKQYVDDLDDKGQVEAFNLLQEIEAAITHAESQKMVCELTRKTGSHRKEKVCMTVAQRDALREDSRAVMEKAKNGLQPGKGFGAD